LNVGTQAVGVCAHWISNADAIEQAQRIVKVSTRILLARAIQQDVGRANDWQRLGGGLHGCPRRRGNVREP
jgi:hypothetical protein